MKNPARKNPRAFIAAYIGALHWRIVSQDRRSTEYAHATHDRLIQILPGGAWAILDMLYAERASGATALGFKRAYKKEFRT